eukprot:5080615-Pyramimonas_sp.AAC.1
MERMWNSSTVPSWDAAVWLFTPYCGCMYFEMQPGCSSSVVHVRLTCSSSTHRFVTQQHS